MMEMTYPYYLANRPVSANSDLPVVDKYTRKVATRVALADPAAIDQAITAAVQVRAACRAMPAYARAAVLQHVVRRVSERSEELADVLVTEAGKSIKDARGEVARCIDTFRIAAEEATRIGGLYTPLDISPRAEGYESIEQRVPIGVCSFISPFNFPVNLVAHKVAPAIAAGCPFILKPASRTPVSALILGEILAETDLPVGSFSILPCRREGANLFATDERLKLLSFTGSSKAGWALKAKAGKMKVVLELGGNAACVVDRDADQDFAAQRIVLGAFNQSGQSCISVQRVIVHESIYDTFTSKLVEAASKLEAGDPRSEDTFLGPLITEDDAKRIEQWVEQAVKLGGKVLCGGRRDGAFFDATFVENVPHEADLSCKEVFGPVATLEPFGSFTEACDIVNDSVYGLQAGVFTKHIDNAFHAFNHLEVGGVVINDVPSVRVDAMPYGGVKDSGLGREGVRSAIEHMTEPRLMLMNRLRRQPR